MLRYDQVCRPQAFLYSRIMLENICVCLNIYFKVTDESGVTISSLCMQVSWIRLHLQTPPRRRWLLGCRCEELYFVFFDLNLFFLHTEPWRTTERVLLLLLFGLVEIQDLPHTDKRRSLPLFFFSFLVISATFLEKIVKM